MAVAARAPRHQTVACAGSLTVYAASHESGAWNDCQPWARPMAAVMKKIFTPPALSAYSRGKSGSANTPGKPRPGTGPCPARFDRPSPLPACGHRPLAAWPEHSASDDGDYASETRGIRRKF